MKLNRMETAGIIASLALVLLAATFFLTQTAYAQSVDPCSVPGMVMFGCDEEGDMQVPVDPCEITPCDDEGPSMAEEINCEIYAQLMAAGEPIPQDFDASGCEDNGEGNEEPVDQCPNDEGMQTETPCPSDDDGEEGGGGSGGSDNSGGSSGGGSGGGSSGGSSGGGSGGGSSGGSSGGGSGGGSVLGASTCHYLTGFVKPGAANDFEQVAKLQAFLKVFEGADVQINGTYDAQSIAAVHAFQKKYSTDILSPWGIRNSTGYVYLTTRKKVNEIYCDRGMEFPLTEAEQDIVEKTKASVTQAAAHAHEETPASTSTNQGTTTNTEEVVDRPGGVIRNFFRRVIEWFR